MTMYLSCKANGCHKDMVQIKQRIQHKLKKIFNIGGSTATQSEETERLREVFTGVQGAGSLAGVARGQRPLAEGNFVFCKLNMHNFRHLNLQKCGRKEAALLFIRERVFEETQNAKFTSLFCQKLYVYKILGIARGKNPLA